MRLDFPLQMAWGEPIASWDFSSSVATVDFTGLAAYRDLLLFGVGVSSDTAGTDNPCVRTSTDDGSTFATTSYDNYGATNVNLINIGAAAGASSVVYGFSVELLDFNVTARKTKWRAVCAQKASATAPGMRLGNRPAELNNALRILFVSGANFTAGAIRLQGRRG